MCCENTCPPHLLSVVREQRWQNTTGGVTLDVSQAPTAGGLTKPDRTSHVFQIKPPRQDVQCHVVNLITVFMRHGLVAMQDFKKLTCLPEQAWHVTAALTSLAVCVQHQHCQPQSQMYWRSSVQHSWWTSGHCVGVTVLQFPWGSWELGDHVATALVAAGAAKIYSTPAAPQRAALSASATASVRKLNIIYTTLSTVANSLSSSYRPRLPAEDSSSWRTMPAETLICS